MQVSESEFELIRIFEDLSTLARYAIYKILEEKRELKAYDLVEELRKMNVTTSYSAILQHLRKMQTNSGLVEVFEKDGKIHVKLKKKVKIEVEDVG
ncbi:hypothetical protein DRP04_15835 [Archaeoglobales archaeon]|nr:MAG: hypothetical protein DRP04_15835 [Archaeoglobales archaeon]